MPKNPIQPNKVKTPRLRFPGFEGVWEEEKFGDIYKFLKTNSFSRAELDEVGEIINIHYGDIHKSNKSHFDISKEKLSFLKTKEIKGDFVKDGDLIVADASEDRFDVGKTIEVLNIRDKKIVSGLHTFLARPSEKILGFSGFLMRTENVKRQFWKIATGASVLGVSKTEVEKIIINLPKLPEQQKIASFLGSVDEWLENLRSQKLKLEQYKKGIMQKIFSQQIRFKDENGKDFPEWEERSLGEIGEIKTSSVDKKIELNEKSVLLLNYMDVYRRDHIFSADSFQEITAKDNQISSCNLKKGDILFTPSSETPIDIGHSAVVMEDLPNVLFSYHLMRFRPKSQILNHLFSGYAFKSFGFYKKLWRLAQGATRFTLSLEAMKEVKVLIPKNLEEQQKIAEFLSSVDRLLELKQQQITKAEEWKKGVMQGLFV